MDSITPKIISPEELHQLLADSSSRVIPLDVSLVYPPASEYVQHLNERIPGSKFFSMKLYAAENPNKLTIMLPTPGKFTAIMRRLGINRDDHLVCYDVLGFWTPARGAWMLKVFGHQKVSVLNGGLPAWKAKGYDTVSGTYPAAVPSIYPLVQVDKSLIADYSEVVSSDSKHIIIDTRPDEEYSDIGHIPGAVSLPFARLLAGPPPDNMCLLPLENCRDIISSIVGEDILKPAGPPVISSCGWGVTACILWLILQNYGVRVTVFDESWEGYEMRAGNPIEKGKPGVDLHSAGATTGTTSFPELQIPISSLPDDGTPFVNEPEAE
ncbi:hypothetical protein VKT23_014711 [Stygiomarasmius scandens]|uniref:Rhodanese domain-containing protein n=1 Tax=Marasmiellus scandens TaxID=2682957 RepID=A0ABR1J2D5_9AGAR